MESAGDLEIAAGGSIKLEAELISNEGHIKLLAGMGITIENDFSSVQSASKYKRKKKKKEESAYETVAIRAALDAILDIRSGVIIHSEYGDINLRAVAITSSEGTVVNASNGGVNLLIAKETDHYNFPEIESMRSPSAPSPPVPSIAAIISKQRFIRPLSVAFKPMRSMA